MTRNHNDPWNRKFDLSQLGISFSDKPIVMGGLAMEYYGIRTCGDDFDFIVSNEDYGKLAQKYPESRKDKWGDLGVLIGSYELFRSIFRLDYDFFAEGAIELDQCRVLSLDRLLFMKMLAVHNQPELKKHVSDYQLMLDFYINSYQNKAYVQHALPYTDQYLKAPDGTIYKGNYD